VAIGYFCLLFFAANAIGIPPQGIAPGRQSNQKLGNADLLGLLDGATRADQRLAVRPEFYGGDGFRVRYVYPVVAGPKANMLNMLGPANWVAMVLYHRDARSAALFEVAFDGPSSKRTFVLLDGANLEKRRVRWMVKDILNGGASTWPEIASHVERVSSAPLVIVRRADVRRTNAACDSPKPGSEFAAISVSGDKSNRKFKDGATEGIPFKTQSGPFDNLDLKSVPSRQVYMNTYGP
jgi:hypothetical protein